MNKRILAILFLGIMSLFSITAVAQFNFNLLQITHPAITNHVDGDQFQSAIGNWQMSPQLENSLLI